MPSNKSELVSSSAVIHRLISTLSREVRLLGGTDQHILRLQGDPELARQVARLLYSGPVEPVYRLTVYPVTQMLWSRGYDFVNSNLVPENFSMTDRIVDLEVNAVLVHLDRLARRSQVLREIENRGLRPATLAELLAFGAQYPDPTRGYPIVALGASWVDRWANTHTVELDESQGKRALHVTPLPKQWTPAHRFLAVRLPPGTVKNQAALS